jgi:predicted protein tyrosine phosphatase
MMARVLFACSQGRSRSAWASHVYARLGVETRYGGFGADATMPLADDDLRWADFIAVFEAAHLANVREQIRRAASRATPIHIPIASLLTSQDPLFRACLVRAGLSVAGQGQPA